MNKERLIDLAKQAGWEYADDDRGFEPLWRFAARVRADRQWVGLNQEEVMESWEEIQDGDWAPDFYAVIEAKLKELNKC